MATWRQCEELVDKGLVRYIGMSNMTVPKLEAVLPLCRLILVGLHGEGDGHLPPLHSPFQADHGSWATGSQSAAEKRLCDLKPAKGEQPCMI